MAAKRTADMEDDSRVAKKIKPNETQSVVLNFEFAEEYDGEFHMLSADVRLRSVGGKVFAFPRMLLARYEPLRVILEQSLPADRVLPMDECTTAELNIMLNFIYVASFGVTQTRPAQTEKIIIPIDAASDTLISLLLMAHRYAVNSFEDEVVRRILALHKLNGKQVATIWNIYALREKCGFNLMNNYMTNYLQIEAFGDVPQTFWAQCIVRYQTSPTHVACCILPYYEATQAEIDTLYYVTNTDVSEILDLIAPFLGQGSVSLFVKTLAKKMRGGAGIHGPSCVIRSDDELLQINAYAERRAIEIRAAEIGLAVAV